MTWNARNRCSIKTYRYLGLAVLEKKHDIPTFLQLRKPRGSSDHYEPHEVKSDADDSTRLDA